MKERLVTCNEEDTDGRARVTRDEEMMDKAINDFRKRLNACVSADGEHFERIIWHNVVKVGDN